MEQRGQQAGGHQVREDPAGTPPSSRGARHHDEEEDEGGQNHASLDSGGGRKKKGGVQTMWCNPTASSPAASRRRDAQCAGKMEECAGSCFRRRSGESREGAEEAAAAFSRPVRPPHRTSAPNLRVFSFLFFFFCWLDVSHAACLWRVSRHAATRLVLTAGRADSRGAPAVRCGAVREEARQRAAVRKKKSSSCNHNKDPDRERTDRLVT